jgi:mono/diheme cytochrome c family protein
MLVLIIAVAGATAGSPAVDKVDFVKDIQPVLQQNCIRCHGPEKQKAHLRLDSREAALEGGKDGPALVERDGATSELVRRISLPKTDVDVMPPEGETLSKEQIAKIKQWIDEGAFWPKTVMPMESATAKAAGPAVPDLPRDFKPSGAEKKAVAALAQKGIDVRPIAMNAPWREANLRLLGTSVNDATIASLKDVASLIDLNLATTKITDKGLKSLKGLTNLRHLHLELTAVTDAGLANLKPLANLTYLNLYGTKVTDAGLVHLKGLKQLRHLYVWQSQVTDEGIKGLKAALPNLEVPTGRDIAELKKKAGDEKE